MWNNRIPDGELRDSVRSSGIVLFFGGQLIAPAVRCKSDKFGLGHTRCVTPAYPSLFTRVKSSTVTNVNNVFIQNVSRGKGRLSAGCAGQRLSKYLTYCANAESSSKTTNPKALPEDEIGRCCPEESTCLPPSFTYCKIGAKNYVIYRASCRI